jgi:hypothetical protein
MLESDLRTCIPACRRLVTCRGARLLDPTRIAGQFNAGTDLKRLGDEVRLKHFISVIPIAPHGDVVSMHGEVRCVKSSDGRAKPVCEMWAVDRDPQRMPSYHRHVLLARTSVDRHPARFGLDFLTEQIVPVDM